MQIASSVDFLAKLGLNPDQAESIDAAPRGERLDLLARHLGLDVEKTMAKLAEVTGLAVAPHESFDLETLEGMPVRLVHEYHCVPVKAEANGHLALAASWPADETMDSWVFAACGRDPAWQLGNPERISKFITQNLGVGAESLDDSADEAAAAADAAADDDEDENAAVIRFVNLVISQAIADGATDIHFEPHEDLLRIRYRIDGLLTTVPVPDNLRHFQDAITSRLKIMAKLNISERRLPQDGRINYRFGNNTLDIRLSTIPTMYGESVSLRLLNKKTEALTLEQLGMPTVDREQVSKVLSLPHGIILVTGPTGSGKSTSLNAFIRQINSPEKRIITIEDPIEYEVAGVNQIQVRPEIGFGFTEALRHVLRQDPNVVMVGEIRDRDTADIAIRASLTGHLVFSTLHTNDSAGALTRLVDMGIEPFLIASGVELVIAQRLVRRLCQACRRWAPVERTALMDRLQMLELDPDEADSMTQLPEPVGCEACRNTGYRGRVGIFEILRVDERFHDLIVRRESSRAIRKLGIETGMQTLERSGLHQIKVGLSSMEEILRAVSMKES
jgi:general secretion pathway protein E